MGPLGAVVVVPVIVLTLRRYRRGQATRLEAAAAAALPLYVIALAFVYRSNPWVGRFMLTPAALVAALFGSVYHHRRYALAVTVVATITVATTLGFNHAEPSGIGSAQSIWTMTRADAQGAQRPPMRPVLEAIAECVPPHATIGYDIGGDDWDYPLFGDRLTRKIVRLDDSTFLQEAHELGLDWVLARHPGAPMHRTGWWVRAFRRSGLTLFQRQGRSDSDDHARNCLAAS